MGAQVRDEGTKENTKQSCYGGIIVDNFLSIVQNKAAAAYKNGTLKDAWGSSNRDYVAEHRIVEVHYRPFVWGIGSALVTFAGFRFSKISSLRPGGKLYNFFGWNGNKKVPPSNYVLSQTENNAEQLNKALSIPLDLALSLLIGGSASLFLFEKDRAMRDMAGLPLVQGRSLVSDTLCKDFISEHKKMSSQFWDRDHSDFPSLDAINVFVVNCKKRDSFEKMWRNKSGTSAGSPVAIPGVPLDFDYSDEEDERGDMFMKK